MHERIQKILSQRGLCSRRTAELWIAQGRVLCNGQTVRLGDSADPTMDSILVDGKPLPATEPPVYILLHKPRGYVTTLSDEKNRRTVAELVAGCPVRVYPVGRLDMDSEGLLLMTNDGELANRLMHPSHTVKKTYRVTVFGYHPQATALLQRRVELDGYLIAQPEVLLLWQQGKSAQYQIYIHEGRNRQVRRMCALAGLSVRRLIRTEEGPLRLGDLPAGKWRYITEEELSAVQK